MGYIYIYPNSSPAYIDFVKQKKNLLPAASIYISNISILWLLLFFFSSSSTPRAHFAILNIIIHDLYSYAHVYRSCSYIYGLLLFRFKKPLPLKPYSLSLYILLLAPPIIIILPGSSRRHSHSFRAVNFYYICSHAEPEPPLFSLMIHDTCSTRYRLWWCSSPRPNPDILLIMLIMTSINCWALLYIYVNKRGTSSSSMAGSIVQKNIYKTKRQQQENKYTLKPPSSTPPDLNVSSV